MVSPPFWLRVSGSANSLRQDRACEAFRLGGSAEGQAASYVDVYEVGTGKMKQVDMSKVHPTASTHVEHGSKGPVLQYVQVLKGA